MELMLFLCQWLVCIRAGVLKGVLKIFYLFNIMTTIEKINIANNKLNITYKGGSPGPSPSSPIIGAWSETIQCGDGSFDVISLSSALPQYYTDGSYDKFFSNGLSGKITGWYENIYNNGKTYFISIGGSSADEAGWGTFLTTLSDDTKLQNFMKSCSCRNITGIDWDVENFDETLTEQLKNISQKLKNNNFKIMFTILLGKPQWFQSLFSTNDDSYYDYVTLMLYNGGMYVAGGSGAGCDWNTWAELFLTNGTGGCSTPLGETREKYIEKSNIQNINPNKIVLGLRNDDLPGGDDTNPATLDIYKTAQGLVDKYKSAGIFFWVVKTGASSYTNMNDILTYLKRETITTKGCAIDWNTCNQYPNKCVPGKPCVASFCFKQKQKGEDSQCSSCGDNPTQWPCKNPGFCEQTMSYPPQNCLPFINSIFS